MEYLQNYTLRTKWRNEFHGVSRYDDCWRDCGAYWTHKKSKTKYRQTSSLKADLSLMSDWHHLKETVLGKGYIISWWQRSSFSPQNNGLGFVLTWEYYCKEYDRYAEKKFSHK